MMLMLELFGAFFKIGLFTIGGGYAMIPMIQQEIVQNHHWVDLEQLVDFIGVAESTPGPFAVNTATFVGTKCSGILGAAAATIGVVLPSFIIILLIAKAYQKFQKNIWVQAGLYGITAVVIGLVAAAIYILFQNIFIQSGSNFPLDLKALFIAGIAALVYFKFKWKAIPIILLSAGLGILLYGVLPMII